MDAIHTYIHIYNVIYTYIINTYIHTSIHLYTKITAVRPCVRASLRHRKPFDLELCFAVALATGLHRLHSGVLCGGQPIAWATGWS